MLHQDHPQHAELLTILQALDELIAKVYAREIPYVTDAVRRKCLAIIEEQPKRVRAEREAKRK